MDIQEEKNITNLWGPDYWKELSKLIFVPPEKEKELRTFNKEYNKIYLEKFKNCIKKN